MRLSACKTFFIFLILQFSFLESKLPDLTPRDVKKKIEKVLKAHASYKNFSEELLQRTIKNFFEEVDPSKTYFLEDEVTPFLSPENEELSRWLKEFNKGDFALFEKIRKQFLQAIERRNRLEVELDKMDVSTSDSMHLQDELPWAKSQNELLERLKVIRALQMEACKKMDNEKEDRFFERIRKRRAIREKKVTGNNQTEREKWLLSNVLKASVASLDGHTNYFTPSEATQFMIQVQQRLFGIGVQLRDNLNGFSVERIVEGGPAFTQKKLQVKDLIVAVNHEPIVGMDILEAVELIRGEKGSNVLLTIAREEENQIETFDIEITRGEVVLEESRLETRIEPYADGVIAHLRLFSFYHDGNTSSASDIKKTLEKIKKNHKLKGVVLDLRSNAGGILPQAVEVTGLFIQKGIVASIKDNKGRIQHLRNIKDNTIWKGPLLVLTNRASASAAEIVAQALQDYGRALVVGDKKTFGKGTFQTFTLDASHPHNVNPQGEFKVTRGKYYTVSGKSPQLVGVPADIVVPSILSSLDIGEEFTKFPLENDHIKENFEDNLSDIPLIHRSEIERIYKHNLQQKIPVKDNIVKILKDNSSLRLEKNEIYQKFLRESEKKKIEYDAIDMFSDNDFQLTEAMNIIKDLIFLSEIE